MEKKEDTEKKRDEIISEYTYTVTHDLNAPLRHIVQYSKLLKEDMGERLGPDGIIYIDKLILSAERFRQLVNDLLSYAQILHIKEEKQTLDINTVIADVKIRLSGLLEKNNATINLDILPTINGYPFRTQELFYHLIRNALTYRGKEDPVVTIKCADKNTHYLFSVQDNGSGISEKHRVVIFKALKRLHSHDEIAGSGLGLAICQKAIAAYGGKIWVESASNKGATFFFTIPREENVA